MKLLAGLLAAVVLVGVGVGGTLGAQTLGDDDPSKACVIAQDWADEYIKNVKAQPALTNQDQWLKDITMMNGLYDVAFKACNP